MKNRSILLFLTTAAFIASGCGSTQPHRIYDEETSATWDGKAYENLLIIGAYDDRPYRVSAESQFAEELKSRGVKATPSYDLFPVLDSLDDNAAIAEEFSSKGFDAVLVVATLQEGYDYDVGDYYATRGMVALLGGRPGAATEMGSFIAWAGSGQYSLYVGVWDAQSGDPAWQISTKSSTTGSESGDTRALADFVVNTLREKGLL